MARLSSFYFGAVVHDSWSSIWFAGPVLLLAALSCQENESKGIGQVPRANQAPADAGSSADESSRVRLEAALPESALEQLAVLAERKRTLSAVEQKLSSALWLELEQQKGAAWLDWVPRLQSRVRVDADRRTLVDIDATLLEESSAQDSSIKDLLDKIEALGGTVVSQVPRYGALQVLLPVDALLELAAEPAVRFVRPALGFVHSQVNTSEGGTAHRAAVIRDQAGIDGSGITIGVLSDGVDSLAAIQASADLPPSPQVRVLNGLQGSGDEGTAMLEIVHDVAPGASLIFATVGESEAEFAANVRALRDAGCDVIVDDVLFLAEGSFQDDIVAQAVNDVVADGALYFSSAGNSGNLAAGTSGTYEGDYTASTLPQSIVDLPDATWLSANDFGGSVANRLAVDSPSVITLEWSDPLQGSNNDYDLFMLSADLADVLAAGASAQNGTQDPLEAVSSEDQDDAGNHVVVAQWSGELRYVRVATHRGGLDFATASQISGHAASEHAFAIAAVDADTALGGAFIGGATNPVEWFSSDGPRRVFYDPSGNPLTPGNLLSSGGALRLKPEFTAADGVTTATPGFSPFHGTSAAAPHAAALAALVLEGRPDIRALSGVARSDAVHQLFEITALDIEAPGFDNVSGHGILMADAASVSCAVLPNDSPCDDADACTQTDTCQGGVCVGSDPVVCSALDECHDAGVCDPATGECSEPESMNGSDCDDGDLCTEHDACEDGVCVGEAVTCSAEDDCFEAGICDPSDGLCYSEPKATEDCEPNSAGGGGSGGQPAIGTAGTGGTPGGFGGEPPLGGASGHGGVSASGGAPGNGGMPPSGGTPGSNDVPPSGGTSGAGTSGGGGLPPGGEPSGSAGTSTEPQPNAMGNAGVGHSANSGSEAPALLSDGGVSPLEDASSGDSGCACRVTGSEGDRSSAWWLLVPALGFARRLRRGAHKSPSRDGTAER